MAHFRFVGQGRARGLVHGGQLHGTEFEARPYKFADAYIVPLK